ncbi:MAG: PCI domain-containing protein [Candidatus Hermodarchaeota archaeon]
MTDQCLFCDSKKIDYTCEKCKSSFCINHMATTEQWECKKHFEIKYSKADAFENGFKCSIIENSKCPECNSLLRVKRLSSGQYYLDCTKCEWNSYLKTPGLFFPSQEQLAKEAKRYNLILGGWKKCGRKLKHITGREICPNCFLELLKRSIATNFSTVMDSFNITAEQMIKLIKKYIEEERIYGIIDQKNRMFYYISSEMRENLISKIHKEGIINVSDLAIMLDMNTEMALLVIYKLISQHQIRGAFSRDKKKYFTQKYINDNLTKIIKEKGRISLATLAKKFDIPQELVKNFCVNLMKTKIIDAFFADRGKEIITTDQIQNEVKKFSKEMGVFKLVKLSERLKIAEELARKSLHEMIKTGSIDGIFTQRREFMTIKYLETKIKELARAYRNMTLREISKRLGVTEASIEENLAKLIGMGEIDGYIDSQKKLFVAYSVPLEKRKGEAATQKSPAQHKDQDKIEALRDYDFEGGQLHFKIVIRNHSNMAINNVKVLLDVPTSYNIKQPLITIPVIESNNSRGVDFYLEPKECGISNIAGTVIYKNALGEQNTIHIRKKEVQIKCPLVCTSLSTIEDCQLSIQDLPNDARAFLIADLDPRLAYRSAIRAIKRFETSMVTSFEGGDAANTYEAEAWFCSEAKVTGGRIITRILVSAASQSLEVRVWCANPGQLTGFLARIIELLIEEINIIRKIKSDEREKTLDVMAITQNLAEISDYCMLKWKAQNIRNKLHDTFIRLRKVLKEDSPVLGRIEFWLSRLNKYEKDENISDDDADKLVNDVEQFRNVLTRSLKI